MPLLLLLLLPVRTYHLELHCLLLLWLHPLLQLCHEHTSLPHLLKCALYWWRLRSPRRLVWLPLAGPLVAPQALCHWAVGTRRVDVAAV